MPIHLQPKVKIELEKLLNEEHIEKLTNCSYQFFISPIVITVKKDQSQCHFAKEKIEWLGHNITQSGVTPLSNKTDAMGKLSAPTNLKKLRSFMGSVNHLGSVDSLRE